MAINWFDEQSPSPGPDLPTSQAALDDAQGRFHTLVEAKRLEIADRWQAASPLERQALLTDLGQLTQAEALVSSHIVQPDTPLDHRHNSLVATTAQSIMANSLKIDEHQFRRQEINLIPELLKRIAEEKRKLGRPSATIIEIDKKEFDHD